jgi:hypothetical protein
MTSAKDLSLLNLLASALAASREHPTRWHRIIGDVLIYADVDEPATASALFLIRDAIGDGSPTLTALLHYVSARPVSEGQKLAVYTLELAISEGVRYAREEARTCKSCGRSCECGRRR